MPRPRACGQMLAEPSASSTHVADSSKQREGPTWTGDFQAHSQEPTVTTTWQHLRPITAARSAPRTTHNEQSCEVNPHVARRTNPRDISLPMSWARQHGVSKGWGHMLVKTTTTTTASTAVKCQVLWYPNHEATAIPSGAAPHLETRPMQRLIRQRHNTPLVAMLQGGYRGASNADASRVPPAHRCCPCRLPLRTVGTPLRHARRLCRRLAAGELR